MKHLSIAMKHSKDNYGTPFFRRQSNNKFRPTKRLFLSPGKLPESVEARILLILDSGLTRTEQKVLRSIFKLSACYNKRTLPQSFIAKDAGVSRETVCRVINSITHKFNDCFGYTNDKRKKNAHRANDKAFVLKIKFNGFRVVEAGEYKKNKIKVDMLTYLFEGSFIEGLPYLARKSVFAAELFRQYKKSLLITPLKRGLLNKLGVKQKVNFAHFSKAALEWSFNRMRELLVKHTKIWNLEGFVWFVAARYDKQYGMLRE